MATRRLRVRLYSLGAAAVVAVASTVVADRFVNPALLSLPETVKIGFNGRLPGWSFGKWDRGTYERPYGFDVAVADYLADRYGFTWEPVFLDPGQREPWLVSGKVDLVISNYSMDGKSSENGNLARSDVLDFAGPYFLDVSGVMFNRAKIKDLLSVNVERGTVKFLCASIGTTAEEYLRRSAVPSSDETPVRATQRECFDRFNNPDDLSVTGMVTDQSILSAYSAGAYERDTGPKVESATWANDQFGFPMSDERYGIAMRNDSPALCRELADAVDDFIADSAGWDRAFAENLAGIEPRGHKPVQADRRLC
ncbi:transporter substrate-binding domain-containing protein [Actinokineospora diospyrosa]|uniref:Glutamate transport system substrate-binding protein n=1 Tax=Actinokineospora diospyrosa TaxID=103728 RepID=A0ABT1IDA9_9PSEU|nr:transporter substrate-binding domain-containing protein [Actinokineospora diospyrosa]MCP2270624.1 glutamate transport system substrate-binding protein [Actinokineospora diospyrosa]